MKNKTISKFHHTHTARFNDFDQNNLLDLVWIIIRSLSHGLRFLFSRKNLLIFI